ncbi:DUF1501 domain-containing protein [Opacimonas viscosa]|uniref:DUF1501 domain-containing protein n=1 Tax=Opacimonas viscosa TaxID=2961944 RepID=A0AA42BMX0_9ALTE|nr:DUF1501 domain-containing protein [Opacimonas viscosa]MCP3429067.1 DUF1501 domain-containing protein [Opacimonas viscosa]
MDRRFFLQSGLASLTLGATAPAMGQGINVLANMANSASNISDYKTLVCVNLKGGADTLSLFIPTSSSGLTAYRNIRNNLTYEQAGVKLWEPSNQTLDSYGMPNFMDSFTEMFTQNKLSLVANVGPLREPTTLDQIQVNDAILPPFFASHSDQEKLWQTGFVNLGEKSGWGGRIIEAMNANSSAIPNNISLGRATKFIRGQELNPFSVNTQDIQNMDLYVNVGNQTDNMQRTIFDRLQNASRRNLFADTYNRVANSAMDNNKILGAALDATQRLAVDYPTSVNNVFVDGELSRLTDQFKRAAQLIEIAPTLGQHRQVIFIEMNAFDTHDNQNATFPALMQALGESLLAFQADLEARGIDDRVVTFTQSEFGRTMTINSNGTDHGWGGHQFVMGTPVNGGQVIGALPEYQLGSRDVYQNTIIPQFSVEQYAGNLAKWFGLSASQITDVFPTYGRFDDVDFGLFS